MHYKRVKEREGRKPSIFISTATSSDPHFRFFKPLFPEESKSNLEIHALT